MILIVGWVMRRGLRRRSAPHHADIPCDLELIVDLLVQFKRGVHVCVGDQIAVGAVVEPRCEHPPQHSDTLDVGPMVVRRHTHIVNAGDNGVGAVPQLKPAHVFHFYSPC